MNAKKCDRCGGYYAPYAGNKYGADRVNTVDLQNDCGGGAISQSIKCFDLCPACMDKQIRFLQCPELISGETKRPLSVPLTLEQIKQMDGELVVVPEGRSSAGGVGIINLIKNAIEGCSPTSQYAWSLDRYGELFVAYSTSTGESSPFYDKGEKNE